MTEVEGTIDDVLAAEIEGATLKDLLSHLTAAMHHAEMNTAANMTITILEMGMTGEIEVANEVVTKDGIKVATESRPSALNVTKKVTMQETVPREAMTEE